MTDRELLELAAKAAGLNLRYVGEKPTVPYTQEESAKRGGLDGYYWNPLTDDGDALRLAVKLEVLDDRTIICAQFIDKDPYAAVRRAIVIAAAEMGKQK